ncbi:MAG: oligosaccharide reducing-end xylanase [Reinekea sp.]|jgi:oligosaccharide reducing-end xylanase|uniref:glycosyl hydrolase family 8 n=1 Tax=Reinekea sp. TaxID=1970455 RepID=UPI00398914C1
MKQVKSPLFLVSVLALTLTACGPEKKPDPSPLPEPEPEIEFPITFPTPRDESVVEAIIDSFADDSLYFTGDYKNWFVELGIASEVDVQEKIQQVYQNYFYSEPSVTGVAPDDAAVQGDFALMYPVGDDMAFINAFDSSDIRSEGQSYGMMITLMMDDQEAFNKIWKFTKTKMQHTSGDQEGFFAWHLSNEAPYDILDANPAPDGEEWFVQALFMAHNRWGSDDGIFDYQSEANELLERMVHKQENTTSYPLMNAENQMITFVNTKELEQYTDPSYHTMAFYELWAVWADHNNQYWHDAAQVSRDFLPTNAHPTTGLFSDYAAFDGTPEVTTFNADSHRAAFDSHRVIANLMMDYMWVSKDATMHELANRNLDHFAAIDAVDGQEYKSVNELDGTPLVEYKAQGQVAMNAAGAIIFDGDYRQTYMQQLWDLGQPAGQWRYYGGLLYMMGLLHVSGEFKIYGDGVIDTDGDGRGDLIDVFPFDVNEWADYDGDMQGDNADTDDDNDNVLDVDDAFPKNANEDTDTDGDGIGNNADTDDDNDGIEDDLDSDPLVSNATAFGYDFTNGIADASGSWTAYNDNTYANYDVQPTHDNTNGVLTITPNWVATTDQFTVKYQQFTALNITNGADLQVQVKVDPAYIADGNLVVQLFLEDANYKPAYLGWTQVNGFTSGEFITLEALDINPATSFGYIDGAFDFTQVRGIGVQFIANGKATSVVGAIEMDNASLTPAALTDVDLHFTDDITGWATSTDAGSVTASLSHNAVAGSLVVSPIWGNANADQLRIKYNGFTAKNIYNGVDVSLSLKVAQSYKDDDKVWFQVTLIDASGKSVYFNTMNIASFASDVFTPITITNVSPAFSFGYVESGFNYGQVIGLGLQMVANGKAIDINGDVEIDYMRLSF